MDAIRAALARTPADVPTMEAIRRAVVSASHYRAEDVPQLRMRTKRLAGMRQCLPFSESHLTKEIEQSYFTESIYMNTYSHNLS